MSDPTVTPGALEHELVIALTRFGVDSRAQAEHLATKLAPWIRTEATALLAAEALEARREDAPDVRPHQVWADSDKRSAGRHVRVVDIDATHATVELCDQRGRAARGHEAAQKAKPGRQTRIRLDRFRATSAGYRLVQDAMTPGGDASPDDVPDSELPGMWEQADFTGGEADR